MNRMRLHICGTLLFFCVAFNAQAAVQDYIKQDTVNFISSPKPKKYSYWRNLLFGHIDRTFERTIDISFFGAPSYTREASIGIGGMASGLYRLDKKDSIMPPSDITMAVNASLNAFITVMAQGNNYFKGNQSLLSYQVAFTRKNLDFWGITYEECNVNPYTKYIQQQVKLYGNYRHKVLPDFYVAGIFDFTYSEIVKIDSMRESYLHNQNKSYITTGIGVSLQYDSRDFIPNPKRGFNIMLRQSIFPEFAGTAGGTLYRTTFTANTYQPLWKKCIVAIDLYAETNNNHSPWSMREYLGGNQRMRGYYLGRYVDNNIAVAQVELRQSIAYRLGVAAWFGAGTVFPTFSQFNGKNILLNYGIGIRFEVKHNTNLRVDYGFGHKTGGFVFGIGEAF